MESLRLVLSCLLFCGLFIASARAQGCTFPTELDGTWDSSHETLYQMTWNASYVSPFDVDTQSLQFWNLTFECNFSNESFYIARSVESISIYTVPYYVYTCWTFEKVSSDLFIQYQATTELASAFNKNYKIYPIAYPVDSALICDSATPYTGDLVSILVKNGTGASNKQQCPVSLWGQYVYKLTDTTGSTFCDYSSHLDICTDTSTLTFNDTLCTDPLFYSTGGTLYCMFYLEDSANTDTYYVYLYNDDASVDSTATYRFTCIVYYYTAAVTVMTQYPNECLPAASQSATTMSTTPGGLYNMYANVTCPPLTDEFDFTIIIIVCVILFLLLLAAGIVAGVYYYKKVYLPKQRERRSSKVSPDALPGTGMSTMTADKNYRMMFTPAPPKSAVPGRRRGEGAGGQAPADAGSRAASAATLRPTVSALATYRTPSPYITDGKDVDMESLFDFDYGKPYNVDSLLDFDYTTSKREMGDPDGAESGVMLEMEGSIPVYSEMGDTPEPTRITPLGKARTAN